MLLIEPGQQVGVRHAQHTSVKKAVVQGVSAGELTLKLVDALELQPGDALQLEIAQPQDALYVVDARVTEVEAGDATCTLVLRGVPRRLQRRQSRRIPARLQSQYILLEQDQEHNVGLILDISRDGALLAVPEPLDLSCGLMLFFELFTGKDEQLTTGVRGKVIREHLSSRENLYSYGVVFDRPLELLAG